MSHRRPRVELNCSQETDLYLLSYWTSSQTSVAFSSNSVYKINDKYALPSDETLECIWMSNRPNTLCLATVSTERNRWHHSNTINHGTLAGSAAAHGTQKASTTMPTDEATTDNSVSAAQLPTATDSIATDTTTTDFGDMINTTGVKLINI